MILPNFPKNCMKLKEFGPPRGRASKILLCRSATEISCVGFFESLASPLHCNENIPFIKTGTMTIQNDLCCD